MEKNVPIQELMTKDPHTIGLAQTLDVAKAMLHEHGIRHLVVLDGVRAVGVLSDRDITYALSVEHKDSNELKVNDVYSGDPYTISPDTPTSEVAFEMAKYSYGCALIKDRDKLIGIFTTVDACQYLGEVLAS